ncbi:MAG: hypothetical protein MUF45_14080 [Spirosomaceae bacterium]|jgi:DNA (cytosine-5)-methyltransferase 1|nr:hypothetical protein [Spirosomataceae bacterium]
MNHKQKLLEIYKCSFSVDDIRNIPQKYLDFIDIIGINITKQKGVFTVLVTLITHKLIDAKQDIRNHQVEIKNGFSGRSIDTKYITPTLKELGLPSMAESGWLTRSLEQPYPYTLEYQGKISDKNVKEAFLNTIDFVQHHPEVSENVLRLILNYAIQTAKANTVAINPLKNPEKITISKIIEILSQHFDFYYRIHGGSKLPVLAFYAVYEVLINEIKRYENCKLDRLGSNTASDRSSKTAGDIQILKNNTVFEAIEIKLDKEIDITIVRVAIEKVMRFNPNRYYILSHKGIKREDSDTIAELIENIKITHGCQIIINGIIPTLKYYLRLITNLTDFVSNYSKLIEIDKELKIIHKEKWNELLGNL